MVGKPIEAFVFAYAENKVDLQPTVWKTAYPAPLETVTLELVK